MTGRALRNGAPAGALARVLCLMAMTAIAFTQIGWAQDDEDYLWEKEFYIGDGKCQKNWFSNSKKNGQDLYVKKGGQNFGLYGYGMFDFERNQTYPVFTGEAHLTVGVVAMEDYTELAGLDAEAALVYPLFLYGLTARVAGEDIFELGTASWKKSYNHTFVDEPIETNIYVYGIEIVAFVTIGFNLSAELDPDVSAQPLGIELKATAKFSPYVELGGGGDFVVCSIGPVIKGNLPGLEFVTDVATYENQPIQLVSYIGWTAPSLELKFEAWDYEKYDCGKGGDVYCTWVDAVWQTVWKTVATSVKRWWGWLTGSEQVSSQELVQVTKTGWGKQRRNVLASVNLKTWTGNAGPRIYIIKYDPYENYMDDATYDCWIGPVRKALTPAKEWVSVGTYTIARSPKMKWSKTTGRSYKNNAGLGYVFEVYPKKLSGWSRYITVKVRKSAYDHGLKVTSWHEVAQKNIFVFRKWYSWDVGTKTVTINDNLRLKFRGINESTSGPWYNPTHVYFDLKITKEEFKVP